MSTTGPDQLIFKLFISGMSVKSIRAIENFKAIAEQHFSGLYDLEIIDLNEKRELAAVYQIIALPTLIKKAPSPVRIMLGDLSNKEKILKLLEIDG